MAWKHNQNSHIFVCERPKEGQRFEIELPTEEHMVYVCSGCWRACTFQLDEEMGRVTHTFGAITEEQILRVDTSRNIVLDDDDEDEDEE